MSGWADEIVLYGDPVAELDRLRALLQDWLFSYGHDREDLMVDIRDRTRIALQPKEGEDKC